VFRLVAWLRATLALYELRLVAALRLVDARLFSVLKLAEMVVDSAVLRLVAALRDTEPMEEVATEEAIDVAPLAPALTAPDEATLVRLVMVKPWATAAETHWLGTSKVPLPSVFMRTDEPSGNSSSEYCPPVGGVMFVVILPPSLGGASMGEEEKGEGSPLR
jgi:hypothetical protein